jgi:cell division protease FtsH
MFRRDPGKTPGKRIKITVWQVMMFVLAITILRPVVTSMFGQSPTDYSYSQFKSGVRGGEIESVVISSDRIEGILRNGEAFRTVRVEDPALLDVLEHHRIEVHGRAANPFLGWLLPLGLMAGASLLLMQRLRKEGGLGAGLFSFSKSKARMTEGEQSGVTFDDIGGAGEAVTDLREITEFLKSPEQFQRLGGKMPKGVLLVGPPGTGKTLLARATAGEAGVPFFSLSGAEFVEMFVGVGASRVRDLFVQAKKKAPAIIFIDEIDAIGGRRAAGAGLSGGHDEREQTLNQLLAEMDGFQPTTGLMLIAATNRPEVLDVALLRPGRFDRRVVVGLPDLTGRLEILKIHTNGITLSDDVELENIARITPGFSGADVANVINEAALLASRDGKDAVAASDFDSAIERVIAGSARRTRAMNEHDKRVVAAHEAGHALAAALLPNVDPVHKVSIIPRGNALGYTWQRPVEDRYIMGQKELQDRLVVLLGGRAAEKLVFAEISTGASDDLARATDLARRMVTEYGMSDELGPVRLAAGMQALYLGASGHLDASVSTATAARVDDETARLVREALERALQILSVNRLSLDELTHQLCEKETVNGAEITKLLGKQMVNAGRKNVSTPARYEAKPS